MAIDRSFLNRLDTIPWDDLEHAHGAAGDIPHMLRQITSSDEEKQEEALQHLANTIYHQGTVYAPTVEAVPFLVQMLATPGIPGKERILYLLEMLDHGQSYHEVHRHTQLSPDVATPEYEEMVQKEVGWVKQIREIIRAGLPIYLPLLKDRSRPVRLYTPFLLLALVEDKAAEILPDARSAYETETDQTVRAGLIPLMARAGERMLDHWNTELRNHDNATLRLLGAMYTLWQEKGKAPRETRETMLQAMRDPEAPELEGYYELPSSTDLVADCANLLSWAGPEAIGQALRILVDGLQHQPDLRLARIDAMLNLACAFTSANPFGDPARLHPLQREVVRTCLVQLEMEWMSQFVNYFEILRNFGLPDKPDQLREYLQRADG